MTNSLRSLIWLKWQYLLSNKVILFVVLSPIVDVYLMSLLDGISGHAVLLSFGTGLIYSITAGSFVTLMVSEEKEKKNIRTLILTGVRQADYIVSVMLYPFVIAVLSLLLLPVLFGITISNWLVYVVVTMLTTLAYIFINFFIALMCKTQMQAAMFSMLIMALGSFLPLLGSLNKVVETIISLTFFGAGNDYFIKLADYQLTDMSFLALLVWVLGLGFLLRFAFAYNRSH